MQGRFWLLLVGLGVLTLTLAVGFPAFAKDDDAVYNRIMKDNKIRCGYYIWPPFIEKDANSGELSGIAYDMMEHIGQQLSLDIEWVSEVSFDSMYEGYQTGRYDMVCAPISATPARARASDFTNPYLYAAYYMYAREGDARFDNNLQKANDATLRYASLDGDMNEILGKEEFPLAQKISVGQNSASTDVLMMVATGKADVTTFEPVGALGFMRANPGKIHQVLGNPVRVMPLTYSFPIGEEKLKAMLNITTQTMLETGYFDRVLAKHPDYKATLLRVRPHYVSMPEGKK
ncbi:MAG: transporter substrate-binding domain-containing protein [Alphaproteobacteria bacterium]|nr:transporter substrate-binding domain-containing protein [Alphaproteobacteria bacterium]